MLSGGYRWDGSRSLWVQVVRDCRPLPGQQNAHLVYRARLLGGDWLRLDGVLKTGLFIEKAIRKLRLAHTCDWPRYCTRLVYDPKVSFTSQNLWRLQVGMRF